MSLNDSARDLPTREWFAGFLGRFHAKALHNPSAWEGAVDELEARLRPAFERLDRMELVIERVREHATKYDHHAYLELLMTTPVSHAWVRSEERDALRADRRACAEALEKHQCPLGHGVMWCGKHNVYHSEDIDAALARPGVQAEMGK